MQPDEHKELLAYKQPHLNTEQTSPTRENK